MSISPSESTAQLTPLYKKLLPKLGVVSNLPLAYRSSVAQCLGLGLPCLCINNVIAKVNFIATHLFTNSLPGKQLCHTLEDLQFKVGSRTQFFALPFSSYGSYCTDSWLTCLWQHICALPLKLVLDLPTLPLQRDGDKFLMDVFVGQGLYSTDELYQLNQVWLYLHYYSLADVLTASGSHICTASPPLVLNHFVLPSIGLTPNHHLHSLVSGPLL